MNNEPWMTKDYETFIKRRKIKDCQESMLLFLDKRHSETQIKDMMAELFWQCFHLRKAMVILAFTLAKIAKEPEKAKCTKTSIKKK